MRPAFATLSLLVLSLVASPGIAHADWPTDSGILCGFFNDPIRAVTLAPDGTGGVLYLGRGQDVNEWDEDSFMNVISGSGDFGAWAERWNPPSHTMDTAIPDEVGGVYRSRWLTGGKIPVDHILANGSPDPLWPVALDTLLALLPRERLCADGPGGVFVAYNRGSSGGPSPRFAVILTHRDATGQLAPGWPATGVVLQNMVFSTPTYAKAAVTDGSGGIVVAWYNGVDLRVQHVQSDGSLDPAWPAAGLTTPTAEIPLQLLATTDGWILVTRTSATNPTEIRARRLSADGQWKTGWPNPLTLITGTGFTRETAFGDGHGGIYAFLQHGTPGDVKGTHIRADGAVTNGWTLPGASLLGGALYSDPQSGFGAGPDGSGGCWFAWDATGVSWLRRITGAGVDHPGWPSTGVQVEQPADYHGAWGYARAVVSGADGAALVAWTQYLEGKFGGSSITISRVVQPVTAAVEPPVARPAALAIRNLWPMPARGELHLALSLAPDSPARLELFDVGGRLRDREEIPSGDAIRNAALRIGADLEPGLYVVRVSQAGAACTARAVIAR